MIRKFYFKIISAGLSLVILLLSYPISFLPWKIDEDFSMNNAFTDLHKTQIDDKTVYAVNKTFDLFNYFGLKYSSDGYCKGHIVFTSFGGKTREEDFFLEPGENMEFFSFIDGVRDAVKHKGIKTISVKNLTGESFELKAVKTFNRKIDGRIVYLSNDYYKIGIDLQWGGALSYLEDLTHNVEAVIKDGHTKVDSNASKRYNVKKANKHVNLINCYDAGRLVQQSYYGPLDIEGYPNGEFSNQKWWYNPVQGGNKYAGSSKIVDCRITDNTIYVKCRPMDWAMPDEWICPAYMEAWYTLEEKDVKVNCRYVDYSGYPECQMGIEVPAFYCVEPLNQMYYYSGNNPWQNEELTHLPDLLFWPDNPRYYNVKENWAAFAGEFDDSFGIGLSVPNRELTLYTGVLDRNYSDTLDPSTESPTSYIAFLLQQPFMFKSFSPIEYEYFISTGNVSEIRDNFEQINK